eukprot:489398_1
MGNAKSKTRKQKCNCKVEHCCKHKCFSNIPNATKLIQTSHYGWLLTKTHQSILQQTLKTLHIEYIFNILIQFLSNSDEQCYQAYYHKNISSFVNNGNGPCSTWLNNLEDNEIKICLLGLGAQGKTTMIHRLRTDTFLNNPNPTIEEEWSVSITVNPNDIDKDKFEGKLNINGQHRNDMNVKYKCCNLNILDTAGQEQFMAILDIWIHESNFFMLLFATNGEFKSCVEIVDIINRIKEDKNYGIMFVATKRDLTSNYLMERKGAMDYCIERNIPYFETSSKDNKNVHFIFRHVVYEHWLQTVFEMNK